MQKHQGSLSDVGARSAAGKGKRWGISWSVAPKGASSNLFILGHVFCLPVRIFLFLSGMLIAGVVLCELFSGWLAVFFLYLFFVGFFCGSMRSGGLYFPFWVSNLFVLCGFSARARGDHCWTKEWTTILMLMLF